MPLVLHLSDEILMVQGRIMLDQSLKRKGIYNVLLTEEAL